MKIVALGFACLLLLPACGEAGGGSGGPTTPSPSPAAAPEGGWKLIEGDSPEGSIDTELETITLEIKNGRMSGSATCNSYGGEVTFEGDTLELTNLSATEIGCGNDLATAESRYFNALTLVERFEMNDDNLTLTGPDVLLRYASIPPPPVAELVDTSWEVIGLIEGRGPDGIVSSASPETLRLGSDKSLRATTGCRTVTGEWAQKADHIALPIFNAEEECVGDKTQDTHILGVLGDGFTVTIEGLQLTVFGWRSDIGLLYRKQS